jgi:preprotein translocase SecE subunit
MSVKENENRRRRKVANTAEDTAPDVNNEAEVLDENGELPKGYTAKKGRATPSRRERDEAEAEAESGTPSGGNVLTRTGSGIRGYYEDTSDELRKVVWPTQEELRQLLLIVTVVMIVASLVLGTISIGFTQLFAVALQNQWLLGGMILVLVLAAGGYLVYSNRRSGKSY